MNAPNELPERELPPIESYCDEPQAQIIDLRDELLSTGKKGKGRAIALAPAPTARFAALSLPELLALPPQKWLVENLFPETGLAVVYGAPGSAKTFLVLDLAFQISRGGGEWFGRQVAGGAVVMVEGEGVQGLAGRARAYCAAKMNEDAEPSAALHIVPHPPNLFTGEAPEFTAAISSLRPCLVVIDTLARSAVGADENSARDMGGVIAAADSVGKKLGCLVLLVHHSSKAGGERGSSALRGAADAMFEVRRHEDGTRELVLGGMTAKAKDSAEAESIFFRLQPAQESCVVAAADAPAAGAGARPRPRGGNQQLVWELLGAAAREQSTSTEGPPKIVFGDLLERWQGSVKDPRKREPGELRRALRSMIESGLIASDSDSSQISGSSKIWCP